MVEENNLVENYWYLIITTQKYPSKHIAILKKSLFYIQRILYISATDN